MPHSLTLLLAGTPDFAVSAFEALYQSEHTISAVLTQPDRPAGRGRQIAFSAVKQFALSHDLPVLQPATLKTPEAVEMIAAYHPDVIVVAAYGCLIPKTLLALPRFGCINIHASLLPRWRGASPIQHAILAGDTESGISIMQLEAGLDTGPVMLQLPCPITAEDTGGSLHDKLSALGREAIVSAIDKIAAGTAIFTPQAHDRATHAAKLTKASGTICWQHTADQIARQIRAQNPWPMANFTLENTMIRVHAAKVLPENTDSPPGTILRFSKAGLLIACGEGALELTMLQFPGKRAHAVSDLYNAYQSLFEVGKQCP